MPITFNSVTLKYTETEPQKKIFFSAKQVMFRVGGFFLDLLSTFWKITVGRVRKSTNKKILALCLYTVNYSGWRTQVSLYALVLSFNAL